MKFTASSAWLAATSALVASCTAQSIEDIVGNKFLSPYKDQAVSNVTGLVTAKGPDGLWIRSLSKPAAVYVFASALAKNATIAPGDVITLNGTVKEYRSSKDYLYLTEITSPKVTAIQKQAQTVTPRVVGRDTPLPPFWQYTSLDGGDVFAVPNNQSLVSVENPVLNPWLYGLDFWESLTGQLVTVKSPRAVGKPNQYGDTWVIGNWPTLNANQRGGLTITDKDANPEAILIGDPLDGSDNPTETRVGEKLADITGIVTYAFGFYRILPTKNITVIQTVTPDTPEPINFVSNGKCSGLTVGDYNIENFSPSDASHVQAVAGHIATYLKTPDIVFVQEVQDNNGVTNDGTVDSSASLNALTIAIQTISGVAYNYTVINPVNNQDGGAPGGNIRVAYLFRPERLSLKNPNPGNSTDANDVLPGPTLKFNPGRIDPLNTAWTASRKPLVAQWQTPDGGNFFTVNVHWGSKGGSSSVHGDARPPVNGGVENRQAQAELTAGFVKKILTADPLAKVIVAGDMNEFVVVEPIKKFQSISGLVDADVAGGIPLLERYTYVFDGNNQELDHMFLSPTLALGAKFEHVHVNTWASYDNQVSDHDPSVAKVNVCKYF